MDVPKIKELISIKETAFLETGVDLDFYSIKERNIHLCMNYIFSPDVKYYDNRVSSLKLLKIFKDNLLDDNKKNNSVIISGYSTGKSHLALVLANYFSREKESAEIKAIYESLEKNCQEETVKEFKEFKEKSKKPQLVILLDGRKFFNLCSGFFKGVKQALTEKSQNQRV